LAINSLLQYSQIRVISIFELILLRGVKRTFRLKQLIKGHFLAKSSKRGVIITPFTNLVKKGVKMV
jgi:hypothetical protein